MLAKDPASRRRLRIVILNDSAPHLRTLCQWLEQHGRHCEAARRPPALQSQPFVITTPDKRTLDHDVATTAAAIEMGGRDSDLHRPLEEVEAAASGVR